MNGVPRFSFDQWVTWLINPVGFLAVVLAFLVLPCASVSVTDWSPIFWRDTSFSAQVAAVAGVFLVLAVLSAAGRMEDNTYLILANLLRNADAFSIEADTEAGFWVSLTGLALILAINLFALRTLRRPG